MKIQALRLSNFRQHVATEISFDSGITGILGPNGSGKTTILEAIAFALYGRGRTSSELMVSLNPKPGEQMRVELEFELGPHSYRVVRSRTIAELYLDGDSSPIATGRAPVLERLQRLLGMSREEFFRTYFTGQKELALMAAMAASDRARFLSKVLGYEKLKLAQDMVSRRRSALAAEIGGLRVGMKDPDVIAAAIAEATQRVEQATAAVQTAEHRNNIAQALFKFVKPKWEGAQRHRERLQATQAEITGNEREELSLAKILERVASELADVAESRAELVRIQAEVEPIAELREEQAILDELYREEGRRKTLIESETALGEELERMRSRHQTIGRAPAEEEEVTLELEQKRLELEEAQGQLEAKRTEWVRDKQNAETRLRELRRQYVDVTEQLSRVEDLGAEGVCPTCSRVLGESFRQVVDHLRESKEALNVDGQYYKKRMEQLAEMPPEITALDERRRSLTAEVGMLERKLAKVQLAVLELTSVVRDISAKNVRLEQMRRDIAAITRGFNAERYDFVRAEIVRLAPLETRCARLATLLEREPQLSKEQEEYARALSDVQSTLGTLRVRLTQMTHAAADFDRLKADYERSAADARTSELELNTARGNLRNATEALDAALLNGEEARRIQETVTAREKERNLHEELDAAFNEMRQQLNSELRPELSELGTRFLRELLDSRTVELELDEKYNINVLEDGVPKPVLSGGEEDLANLVLRLAVSQMIAERSGQLFSLLILDEVFGSLDEPRRFSVLELLRALGDRFEQVILISHIESVRDGLDRVIRVRYDPALAASVVEQETVVETEPVLELAGVAE